MTPATFARTYGTLADEAARATSLSRWTVLAQWAVETGWGSSPLDLHDDNLAGIRWYGRAGTTQVGGIPGKIGTGFAHYRSLSDFVVDYAHTMNLPAYAKVRAAVGVDAELRALGASPWDAGHYRVGGVVGGSVLAAWHRLPVPAASWFVHVAHGATIDHYATGDRQAPAGAHCVDGHVRVVWTRAGTRFLCRAPVTRPRCGDMRTTVETVQVSAGPFAGRHVQVTPRLGVTVTKG
jgi:hypothetical protein